jgi:integrase
MAATPDVELVRVTDALLANYRGQVWHGFLFKSQKQGPLAARSLNDVFEVLTANLSEPAKRALKASGWDTVSPHPLRHTAAVHRLARYRERGDDLEVAIEKLRVFFGWSPDSEMPRHYARAYFETTLAAVWNENFDSFVETLRGATGEQE